MTSQQQKKIVVNFAESLGFDIVRVACPNLPQQHEATFARWIEEGQHGDMDYLARRLREDRTIEDILPGVKSVISLGVNYFRPEERSRKNSEGWVSRYATTRDYHKVIKKKLIDLSRFISAEFSANSKPYVDTGPILERAYADSSGIGYIGKNTCVITEDFGSWVFLAEVLTTLDLPHDKIDTKINCGTCRRCIDKCPTNAINEDRTIDARKCISYLTIENKGAIPIELRDLVGGWLFGCDICQEVCPHNIRAVPAKLVDFNKIRIKDRLIPLAEILGLKTDADFLQKFAGTPIMRAKRRGLIRNACVVAGNSGQKALIPALETVACEADEMLKEHANWAIEKLSN